MNLDCWDRNTPSNSPRALGAKSKFGTERSHREDLFKSVNYHERGPCAPKFEERALEETLQQERCARRVPWDLAKNVYKLKHTGEASFRSVDAHAEQKRFKLR